MRRNILLLVTVIFIGFLFVGGGCESQYLTAGKVYRQSGQYDKAIEQFKLAIKAEPQNAKAYLWLGRTYGDKNMWKEAAENFDKAYKLNKEETAKEIKAEKSIPNPYWIAYYNAGLMCFKEKDYENSKKYVEDALKIASNKKEKTDTYLLYGSILNAMGDEKGAMEKYKEVLKIDPKNALAYQKIGGYYINNNKIKESIPYLEKATELDSTNSSFFFILGYGYLRNGEMEKAVNAFKRSIEIDSTNASAYHDLAITYFNMKKIKEGIEPLKKAIELYNKNGVPNDDAYNRLGLAYYQLKDYTNAISVSKESLEKNPNNCEAIKIIVQCYSDQGQRKLGEKYYKILKERCPNQ
ncbi:tetratricopeptide repeat protein [candidate division WOR-3 bacterium]|nr:tetratricopeptide repeat protein [candidate division WOR-3 bacterium]